MYWSWCNGRAISAGVGNLYRMATAHLSDPVGIVQVEGDFQNAVIVMQIRNTFYEKDKESVSKRSLLGRLTLEGLLTWSNLS